MSQCGTKSGINNKGHFPLALHEDRIFLILLKVIMRHVKGKILFTKFWYHNIFHNFQISYLQLKIWFWLYRKDHYHIALVIKTLHHVCTIDLNLLQTLQDVTPPMRVLQAFLWLAAWLIQNSFNVVFIPAFVLVGTADNKWFCWTWAFIAFIPWLGFANSAS